MSEDAPLAESSGANLGAAASGGGVGDGVGSNAEGGSLDGNAGSESGASSRSPPPPAALSTTPPLSNPTTLHAASTPLANNNTTTTTTTASAMASYLVGNSSSSPFSPRPEVGVSGITLGGGAAAAAAAPSSPFPLSSGGGGGGGAAASASASAASPAVFASSSSSSSFSTALSGNPQSYLPTALIPGADAAKLLEQITCLHCHKPFQEPRTLPCLHAFCFSCIKDLAAEFRAFKCPQCLTEVSTAVLPSLPATFWAPILADAYQKATQRLERMDACNNPARLRCVNCADFLCEGCVQLHKSHPRFASHKTISLEEFDAPIPPAQRQLMCSTHPDKPLEVYCEGCKIAVCLSCAVFQHNGHRTDALSRSIVTIKNDINANLATTHRKLGVVNEALAGVGVVRRQVSEQQAAITAAIRAMLQPLREALDAREQLLIKFNSGACGERLSALQHQEETLLFHQRTLLSALAFCDRSLSQGGDAEVVSVAQPVFDRLRRLDAVWVPAQPCCEANVSLVVDEAANTRCLDQVERIGAIENPELHIPHDPSLPPDPDAGKPQKRNYASLRNPRLVLANTGEGPGQLRNPFGVCARPGGSVVVCDFGNSRLVELFTDGRAPRTVATFGQGKGPVGVTQLGDHLLTVDAKHQVSLLRPSDGSVAWAIGARGTNNNQLNCPFGVAVLATGTVVVSDQNNHRLQLVDAAGKFLGTLPVEMKLDHPRGLAVDTAGNVVVADHVRDRVVVLSPTGSALHSRGSSGAERGQLNRPFDVAVDALGNVLVADWGNSRVVVFSPSGEASHFPTPGKPQGICVDSSGNVIVALFEGQVIMY